MCAPPLLLAAALDFTAHIAAAPALRRLESELPDADAARRRFANADVERSGRLVGGALSRLSVAVQPGSSALLRGVSMALCPLGGHAVTAEGLAHWRSARAESTPHRGKGSTGEEEEAAVVGGDAQEGGGSKATAPPFLLKRWRSCLRGHPVAVGPHTKPPGPSPSQPLSSASAPPSPSSPAYPPSGPIERLCCSLPLRCRQLPCWLSRCIVSPSICSRSAPVRLAPQSRHARAPLRWQRCAWPPMTLSTARAAVLLVDGAALWQALPPAGDGLLPAPLAMLIGLALLWSVFFAGAALWLAEQSGAERQLVEVLGIRLMSSAGRCKGVASLCGLGRRPFTRTPASHSICGGGRCGARGCQALLRHSHVW